MEHQANHNWKQHSKIPPKATAAEPDHPSFPLNEEFYYNHRAYPKVNPNSKLKVEVYATSPFCDFSKAHCNNQLNANYYE